MVSFLFPILLICYGEFSDNIEIRYTARVLFYSYALSILLPFLVYPDYNITASYAGALLFLAGISYSAILSKNYLSRTGFTLAGIFSLINYLALFTGDYTLLKSVPFYMEYSHVIIRDSILVGLAYLNHTLTQKEDLKLEYCTMFLVSMEWIL